MEAPTDWQLLLSVDDIVSAVDIILSSGSVQIETGGSHFVGDSVTLPDRLPLDTYTFIASFDPENAIDEEGSEVKQQTQEVAVFREDPNVVKPDLIVTQFSADFGSGSVRAGDKVALTFGVRSDRASAVYGRELGTVVTDVDCHASSNETITNDDFRLDSGAYGILDEGVEQANSFATTPTEETVSQLPDRRHFLRASVKSEIGFYQGVEESDETNNAAANVIPFTIGEFNSPPVGEVVVIGNKSLGSTLTGIPAFNDADEPGPLSYQWLHDGRIVADATEMNYTC